MDSYAGNILDADLTNKKFVITPFPDDWKRLYLGGRRIGIRILTDLVDPVIDHLIREISWFFPPVP